MCTLCLYYIHHICTKYPQYTIYETSIIMITITVTNAKRSDIGLMFSIGISIDSIDDIDRIHDITKLIISIDSIDSTSTCTHSPIQYTMHDLHHTTYYIIASHR